MLNKEINLSILSLDELINLRKECKNQMTKHTPGSREYYIAYCKTNIIRDEINKRSGLYIQREAKGKFNEFREELKKKDKEEINKQFEDFKRDTISDLVSINKDSLCSIINTSVTECTEKCLNVEKIQSLDDVKRVLKFLNIKATDDGIVQSHGFDEVRDLFE